MALRLTIQQYLQTAKRSFFSALNENRQDAITIVSGNQSADLDSVTCSILYSYLSEFAHSPSCSTSPNESKPSRVYLPLINIPRDEVELRPELLHLATSLSFTPSDLTFLDELPPPSSTGDKDSLKGIPWVLLDHNARTGPLRDRFGTDKYVTGIIDHHVDEGSSPNADPRIIETSGSCMSLVTSYFRDRWDTLHQTLPSEIGINLAKMALVPVLIDTGNLVSKVTPADTNAVNYLLKMGEGEIDREQLYDEFMAAKGAIDDFPMRDLLRKDYKEYEEDNGVVLGISSIGRSLEWMVKRDGKGFVKALDAWAKERKLEVLSIVSNNGAPRGGEYKREVLVRGVSDRARGVAEAFGKEGKEELGLTEVKLDVETGEGTISWDQAELQKGRKQVAPLLRSICALL